MVYLAVNYIAYFVEDIGTIVSIAFEAVYELRRKRSARCRHNQVHPHTIVCVHTIPYQVGVECVLYFECVVSLF